MTHHPDVGCPAGHRWTYTVNHETWQHHDRHPLTPAGPPSITVARQLEAGVPTTEYGTLSFDFVETDRGVTAEIPDHSWAALADLTTVFARLAHYSIDELDQIAEVLDAFLFVDVTERARPADAAPLALALPDPPPGWLAVRNRAGQYYLRRTVDGREWWAPARKDSSLHGEALWRRWHDLFEFSPITDATDDPAVQHLTDRKD